MKPATFLNLAGALILLGGILAAFVIHRQAGGPPPDDDAIDAHPSAPLALRDSKKLSAGLEQNWGKLGNLSFSNFGGDHPQALSLLVLGISAGLGLGCLFAADRLDR